LAERVSVADWYEFLVDSLDAEQPRRALTSYRGPADQAATSIRDYFRQPAYPYHERLDFKTYYRQKLALQIELVKLQNWIVQEGMKLLILFEGRDTAGKGSTIKHFTEHLNPRGVRVVALDKPTERERSQWYFQRYVAHLPSAGEIVLFDRSWYNRAGVERVMGFCTEEQYWDFVHHVPLFENMLTDDDIHLVKFYLSISKEEQASRIEERRRNPLKQWKLSPIDQEAQTRWDAYTEAKEETFQLTDGERNPWTIIKADDQLRARLEAMRCVLALFAYEGRSDDAVGTPDPGLVANAARIYGHR
jgi:polyphosphate kinase 2